MRKITLSPIVIFANWWWWSVFSTQPINGILMLLSGGITLIGLGKNKRWLLILAVIIMSILQWQTTTPRSLIALSNDEQRVVEERKSAYPPITWAPVAYYLEEKPVSIAVGRWLGSVFENLDPNQYFFANHPREGIATNAIEKLPFVLLPLALLGLYLLFFSSRFLFLVTAVPIFILALIGNQNQFGGLSTWPLWIAAIDMGWRRLGRDKLYIQLLFVAAVSLALWQKSFLFF